MLITIINNLKKYLSHRSLHLRAAVSKLCQTDSVCPGRWISREVGHLLLLALMVSPNVYIVSHPAPLLAGQPEILLNNYSNFNDIAVDFTVSERFSSHLPLLVLEAESEKMEDSGGSAHLLIYSGSPANTLTDSPAASVDVRLQESHPDVAGKKTYEVDLMSSKDGQINEISLAGLPKAGQWRLQGSTLDKGMLRNGLAYELGRILFPAETPQTRYCEVLYKVGGRYHYQGIYILAQSDAEVFQAVHGSEAASYLLRYSPERDMSRNSFQHGQDAFLSKTLSDRGFVMIYPSGDQINLGLVAEADLDSLESALTSLTPGAFLKYLSLMNQKSAIDLYILNAMLLNAEAGPISFYLAGSKGGPLGFQPVWAFDQALDNTPVRANYLTLEKDLPDIEAPSILSRKVPVWRQLESGGDIRDLRLYPLYQTMDGDSFLWFDRLFLSRPFLVGLLDRYHELRRGPLAPERVSAIVDALALELGPALERDWTRWSDLYEAAEGPLALTPFTDAEGEILIRQTASYDQELVKIRYLLRQQDAVFMEQIAEADRLSADLFDKSSSGNRQAGYALATIIAFLFLTHLLTRKV
ncbi:hypothetical protein C4J81_00885 [Deltaproteobacteria bacterium Smac51]|nr:hypothetical protein C4J81_00885 [Deltaproteobacteria bacterium Smac51]